MGQVDAAIRLRRPVRADRSHVGPQRLGGVEGCHGAARDQFPGPVVLIERREHVPRASGIGTEVVGVHASRYTVDCGLPFHDGHLQALARGSQEEGWGGYPVSELAMKYNASSEEETDKPEVAYARFPRSVPGEFREDWLP